MSQYLLAGQVSELERLRLQSLVWERAARQLFEAVPVQRGWRCLDIGCGAIGVLRPLSEAVGATGSVLGIDVDESLLASARSFIAEAKLSNVKVRQADLFADDIGDEFDLVHLRFMFAPIGRESELLSRALKLCRPGGVIVIQEPDAASWSLVPRSSAFDRLRNIIIEAFKAGGGDFNAGSRTFSLVRDAGLTNIGFRAAVEGLPPRHPYLRVALQFAASLRRRIVANEIAAAEELDALVKSVENEIASAEVAGVTFVVTQVWATKP
jgi:ubiquinone/menaquinone biosynthesis C-methylase UbiE